LLNRKEKGIRRGKTEAPGRRGESLVKGGADVSPFQTALKEGKRTPILSVSEERGGEDSAGKGECSKSSCTRRHKNGGERGNLSASLEHKKKREDKEKK